MSSVATTESSDSVGEREGAFAILANHDFRLFWIGACVSFIGSWVQIIAMGLMVYEMTHSKAWLGIIGLASGIPVTVLMLFGGVVADRANKRNLVILTQSLFAIDACALAVLVWTHSIQVWQIIILSLVNGVVFALDGPARQAMIYDLVGPDHLSAGVALQSAAFNVARIVGPAIGSLLYAAFGPGLCFFANGISFIAVIIALLMVKTDLTRRGELTDSVWFGLVEGLRHVRANREMRSVVGLTAVTSVFAMSVYTTLMPALAKEMLGIGERDPRYGWLFSAIGAGSVIGAVAVGRSAAAGRRGLLMVVGANAFAASLLALARCTHVGLALVVFLVIGLAAIAQLATANSLTQSLAPDALRGRAVAMHMFAMAGLQPFGSFLAGAAAQRWGVPVAIAGGAVIFWVYAAGVVVGRPHVAALE